MTDKALVRFYTLAADNVPIPVNNAVTATYGIGGLKAAMYMLGYFGGDPRLPLLPSNENEKTEIVEILVQADLLVE